MSEMEEPDQMEYIPCDIQVRINDEEGFVAYIRNKARSNKLWPEYKRDYSICHPNETAWIGSCRNDIRRELKLSSWDMELRTIVLNGIDRDGKPLSTTAVIYSTVPGLSNENKSLGEVCQMIEDADAAKLTFSVWLDIDKEPGYEAATVDPNNGDIYLVIETEEGGGAEDADENIHMSIPERLGDGSVRDMSDGSLYHEPESLTKRKELHHQLGIEGSIGQKNKARRQASFATVKTCQEVNLGRIFQSFERFNGGGADRAP